LPHWPTVPPESEQRGLAVLGHACVAPPPRSPSQAAQVFETASHVGIATGQNEVLFTVHCEHLPASGPARLHTGSGANGHAPMATAPKSALQALHLPSATKQTGVAPEQFADAFALGAVATR